MNEFKCKFCGNELGEPFLELGDQPLCNNYISNENSRFKEAIYPLDVYFCSKCFLVQLAHSIAPSEIFNDYAYLSSFSSSWLKHAEAYSNKVIERFQLNDKSFVVEIASNDGYLLKNFINFDIPVLGIEPATNASLIAKKLGIDTIEEYFNSELSQLLVKKYSKPDLIITNNVYAHVPNINDFTRGIKNLLKDDGVWTLEFPYLKNLLELNQFDTIYHEHYYYFSLHAIDSIFRYHELKIFDVEELPSHGGSLRLFITHSSNRSHYVTDKFSELMNQENIYGLHNKDVYGDFKLKVNKIKSDLTGIIEKARSEHKKIAGYGAAGKGNTLLNFCGITPLQIDFIVDRNPLKQNKLMPGSRIPIFHPETILTSKPDYILILPWNLKKEIMESNKFISNWGGKFILPIPEVQILEEAA